ncbi:DUF6975 family protein [Sphingosinithalassobacter sp. LHW66-3]|uniref:DUF6975 family protein n=1 Tax=Sphingosinithalassobacter sp. LHW66-3 TaxID=3424718 RepID=UPI003D6A2A2C
MPFDSVQIARQGGIWGALDALAASDGSAGHPYVGRLRQSMEPLRDLADAAHYLCLLHGRHPGVIDHALPHARDSVERAWLEAAAEAFAAERALLVQLVAAAGPLPSTPGQAESDNAALHQRHAVEMLSQSDRAGCATGTALALVLDWTAIRAVLNSAAERLGLEMPETRLPPIEETASVVAELSGETIIERAILFGAEQLFAQHRGLWELLEARMEARGRA